ncbi:hypothetical protein BANRA_05295 [Klebsiella pneumoniae]|nr:hypothetical protein BANRA_05295 [Klebsiella pneumoniae]
MEFGRFAAENRAIRKGKPETFNFLGSRTSAEDRNGRFMLIRKTRRDRMTATLKAIKDGLRRRWHYSIPEQGKWLRRVVQGYLNYHSVPGNFPTMQKFRTHVTNLWRRALRRRSQKDDTTRNKLAAAWLPRVRVLHPWPVERFTARHPRQEPVRKSRTPGSVRGYPVTGIPTATLFAEAVLFKSSCCRCL